MKGRRVSDITVRPTKPEHPLLWLAEPLRPDPTLELRAWFGGRTIMLRGCHQLFLTCQGEPWQGVLVCTFHEQQPSLCAEIPSLAPHPILRKWLYLPESSETFERDAKRLVQLVRAGDPRIGVPPSARKKRAKQRIRFGDRL
ncbi:MAG TPA: hypothetical protein VHF69_01810 [Candidatus Synoicihabitans sp.]|nr:hypothetical protein [Candidatus Synoicihabitans sp.]